MTFRGGLVFLVTILALCGAGLAGPIAVTIGGPQGTIVTSLVAGAVGNIGVSGTGNSGNNQVVVFDPQDGESGPDDTDLEGPTWAGGNLPTNTVIGNLLILQETNCMVCAANEADDDASGGMLTLDFTALTASILGFGFDVIDVEGAEPFSLQFHEGMSTVLLTYLLIDGIAVIMEGDNTANRVPLITAASLGFASIDKVDIIFTGSGAIGGLVLDVPEPGSIGLVLLGLSALGLARRRR